MAKATLGVVSSVIAGQLRVIVILAGSGYAIGGASEAHFIPTTVAIRILRFEVDAWSLSGSGFAVNLVILLTDCLNF